MSLEILTEETFRLPNHKRLPSLQCFPNHIVNRWLKTPPNEITEPQEFVYMTIKPFAGTELSPKSASDFYIGSICEPQHTLCGLDMFESIGYKTWEPILRAHILKLRTHPMLKKATIIVNIETFSQGEFQQICQVVQNYTTKRVDNEYATNSFFSIDPMCFVGNHCFLLLVTICIILVLYFTGMLPIAFYQWT